MLSRIEQNFSLIYAIILLLVLITGSLSTYEYYYFTKPLLMLSLFVFFYKQSQSISKRLKQLMLSALICAWFGDIFMLLSIFNDVNFIIGLFSFFLCHVFFIIIFFNNYNENRNVIGFLAICLLYILAIYYFIYDGLGSLFYPVTFYVASIASMATFAFMQKGKISDFSFYVSYIGSIFFLISDTFLALNMFYTPIPYPTFFVMLTYGIAMYLITLGILKFKENNI